MTKMRNLAVDKANVISEVLEGEAVIINVATGIYHSTDGVGGWVWENIVAGVASEAILGALEPLADPAMVRDDLIRFFDQLDTDGLVGTGSAPATSTVVGQIPTAYGAPGLQTYRDMTELMALDPPMPILDGPVR